MPQKRQDETLQNESNNIHATPPPQHLATVVASHDIPPRSHPPTVAIATDNIARPTPPRPRPGKGAGGPPSRGGQFPSAPLEGLKIGDGFNL